MGSSEKFRAFGVGSKVVTCSMSLFWIDKVLWLFLRDVEFLDLLSLKILSSLPYRFLTSLTGGSEIF